MGQRQIYVRERLTPERKAAFVQAIKETGSRSFASRVATPHSRGNPLRTFTDEMERDEIFREEVEAALAEAHDSIRAEIKRRAIDGWEQNVWQRGRQVWNDDGTPAKIKMYSDRMLELMARVLPELTPKSVVDSNINLNVQNSEPSFRISKRDIFYLSPEERKSLARIVLAISKSRGGVADVTPIKNMPVPAVEHQPDNRDPWEDSTDE